MAHLPKGQGIFLPPFKAWLASNIPAVYDNTMSYYEELVALIKYLQDIVVPAVNDNAAAVTAISEAQETLQAYVDNYFDNLDVQEEINNKLDQMAEDGTLQEIITTYIQANTAWCFDTVADMKLADNFINGSFAQTLGYHAKNDGGASLYKIRTVTNEDDVDEATIIALANENLVAELIIKDHINAEQFGAYGDNTHDDTSAVQACLNSDKSKHCVLSKSYKITTGLSVPNYKVVDGGGEIHSSGECFALDGCARIMIRDLKLYPTTNAIHITSTNRWTNYNTFEDIYCYGNNTAQKGLFLECTQQYINEQTYRNCSFMNFQYGIYAINETTYEMSAHHFYGCSTEGSQVAGQYIKNGNIFSFINCRHAEPISCKWITEGTCHSLLIIGGMVMANDLNNMQFSATTDGQMIGNLRGAGIYTDNPQRNALIIDGKVVPQIAATYYTRMNIASDTTINYGQSIYHFFNFNADVADTLTLTNDYYGGAGKINEIIVRVAGKTNNTSTVKIGSYTKVLPAGSDDTYRFTYCEVRGGYNWVVEKITEV